MSPAGFLLKIRKDFLIVSHPGRDRPSRPRTHAPGGSEARRPQSHDVLGPVDLSPLSAQALRLEQACHTRVVRFCHVCLNFLRFLAPQSKGNSRYHLTEWKCCISVHNQEISSESKYNYSPY